jgi:hypothetical protein
MEISIKTASFQRNVYVRNAISRPNQCQARMKIPGRFPACKIAVGFNQIE